MALNRFRPQLPAPYPQRSGFEWRTNRLHGYRQSSRSTAYALAMGILDPNGFAARALRYGAVGGTVNGAGYLACLLVTSSGLSPRLTVTVLLPASLWAAFRLHGRVTFASTDCGSASGMRFLAISLAGYTLNLAPLTVLVDAAGHPPSDRATLLARALRTRDVPHAATLRVLRRLI